MNKTELKIDTPRLLNGALAIDVRGTVSFVNQFKFPGVKRFYMVESSIKNAVRAWHGHKKEAKYVFAVSGKVLIGAVKIDNWKSPSAKAKPYRFLLSSKKPAILYIPKAYANGFKSLTKHAKIIFFSTSTLAESKNDDFRFDAKYWDIWD